MKTYSIEKHNGLWSVWETIENHGIGFKAIYTPLEKNTRKACAEWCKLRGIKIGKHKKSSRKKETRAKKEV